MQAVQNAFVVGIYRVCIVRRSFLLCNCIEHNPLTISVFHLNFHQLIEFAIRVVPLDSRLACREHFARVFRWAVLRRSGWHEVVLPVVAEPRSDACIVLSGFGEIAVLVELRGVAFAVPIVVALYAVVVVHRIADATDSILVLTLGHAACKGSVAVPRSTPYPFRNPDRSSS